MAKVDDFDENDFEEDDEDDEEEEPEPPKRRGRPKKSDEEMLAEEEPKKKPVKKTQRYTAFYQQEASGIADVETNEVVATNVLEALANIMARLEKIELTLGNMLGTR